MNPSNTRVIRQASWVVVWDEQRQSHVYRRDIDIAFSNGAITALNAAAPSTHASDDINGRGMLVIPGLVNIHAHPSSEAMNKGLTDEVGSSKLYHSSLYEYLFLLRADAAGMRAAMEVALSELLQSGVTTLCDLSVNQTAWLDTLGESGLRVYAEPMFRSGRWYTANGHEVRYEWDAPAGQKAFDDAVRTTERAAQHPSGRLSGMIRPARTDMRTPELIRDAVAAGRERRIVFQGHAAQSVVEFHEIMRRHGMTPIEWLNHLGALGPASIIGHGIFLDHHDWLHWPTRTVMRLLAETQTSHAHCSTVFSRRGITLQDAGGYRAAGVNIGIGTDTFPHNMIEEMRCAAIAARITRGDPGAIGTADIFNAATVGGANALGRADIGRLAPGIKADFVMIDATHPSMRPVYDPIHSLIYSSDERAVRHVFIDGRQVVRDGKALAFNYADAAARLEKARRRAAEKIPQFDWARRHVGQIMPRSFDTLDSREPIACPLPPHSCSPENSRN